MKVSWIIPIHNEAPSLPQLFLEIEEAMGKQSYEIISVDDASTDATGKVLRRIQKKFPQLKMINLGTRQGKWAALVAGIKCASGSLIITIDSDLQDDPRQVRKLISMLNCGYDVVSGWRKKRADPWYKVLISKTGNWLLGVLGFGYFHDVNSPYKLYRKEVMDNIPTQGSLLRFSLALAQKVGYRVCEVEVTHRPRRFGSSKFGILKYIRILYDVVLVYLLFSGSGRIVKRP